MNLKKGDKIHAIQYIYPSLGNTKYIYFLLLSENKNLLYFYGKNTFFNAEFVKEKDDVIWSWIPKDLIGEKGARLCVGAPICSSTSNYEYILYHGDEKIKVKPGSYKKIGTYILFVDQYRVTKVRAGCGENSPHNSHIAIVSENM